MQDGELNLKVVAKQNKFNDWMFEEIEQFVTGNILEVGSGIGTISRRIIKCNVKKVFLTDIFEGYLSHLRKEFGYKSVMVDKLDLDNKEDFKKFEKGFFDTIVCLNVLEHVKDDFFAMKQLKELLKDGGRLILLVPAHKYLYNELDKAVLHYRRYVKNDLLIFSNKLNFRINKIFYFNFVSIFGWFINGTIFKKKEVNVTAAMFLNKLTPLFKFIERYVIFKKVGLSLIAIYEK